MCSYVVESKGYIVLDTEEVAGSNPVVPTININNLDGKIDQMAMLCGTK